MLIMNRKDLETFIESDDLREFIISASDYELSIVELVLKCFGTVTASISHTDRNNKVAALAILKLIEGARGQQVDSSSSAVENTTRKTFKNLSTKTAEDQE